MLHHLLVRLSGSTASEELLRFLRIDETLEGFCDAFAGDRRLDGSDRDSDVLPGHCVSLLDAHGETVGDHVFAHGPRHMRNLLCVRLARACPVLVGTKRDDEGEL